MMKSIKSYVCKISGNKLKLSYLQEQLDIVEDLSWYIFTLKQQFGIDWWFNQKKIYHQCRKMFPDLNSKILQNFIRYSYKIKKGMKLPKKPVGSSIILDYQLFDFQINSSKLTKYWLRFQHKNFALFGERSLKRLGYGDKIQLVQIYKRNNEFYCKISISRELLEPTGGNNIVGCDINYKRIVLSNNIFYNIKQLAHKKIEHKKNNQKKKNFNNYTKNYLHKLTNQISKDLLQQGVEVLVLEDLKNLRKSASRKLGTSKGKTINYIVNSMPYSMFQNYLKYKCLDLGIKVEIVNPAYTSKTCSRCNSRNTLRPRQEDFICLDCNFKLNADLNGSRNIEKKYTSLNGQLMSFAQD